MAFAEISNQTDLFDIISRKEYESIHTYILVKPVQAGKTSDILKLVEIFYKTSAIIFVSDKNSSLAHQTNSRAKNSGFTVTQFDGDMNIGRTINDSFGRKKITHFLMEINNLSRLADFLAIYPKPVTLVIDEGDKSRNTVDATTKMKKSKNNDDEDDDMEGNDEAAVAESLPTITQLLLIAKNFVKENGGKTVFVTATPIGIMTSEKDERLVIYKKPYNNYTGIGLNHEANIMIRNWLPENACKAAHRWTHSSEDRYFNTWREPVSKSVKVFSEAINREPGTKQLMLISLEQRNLQQELIAKFIGEQLESLNKMDIPVVIFNGENKESSETLGIILKKYNNQKIIVVAGFCASRGVSFTDFSDPENKYELIIQVHASKKYQPLNSITQAIRLFGPARRTVNAPLLICNRELEEDIKINIPESYRIMMELAEGNSEILRGNLNPQRRLTQSYNFRYLKQRKINGYSSKYDIIFEESWDPKDHLPFISLSECL